MGVSRAYVVGDRSSPLMVTSLAVTKKQRNSLLKEVTGDMFSHTNFGFKAVPGSAK